MDQLHFLVQGSTPNPYEVTFIKDGDSLTAICSCPAGEFGNFCKHRIGILDGSTDGIKSDNAGQVPLVQEWLAGTDVEAALTELRSAEKDAKTDKKAVVAAKRKLARAMNS